MFPVGLAPSSSAAHAQCSHDENFAWLNRPDPGNYAVHLSNPKSLEFQVVRTSLLPGMLKTARENKSLPLPMKIFEVSDVTVQDAREERQARNHRRLVALYMDRKAGFEVAHGLLDRVMQVLGVPFLQREGSGEGYGYYIRGADGECVWLFAERSGGMACG
jgi:phenylalanyl-tRNA synthetase beta chain